MGNPVEVWKAEKHGLDVWPDLLRYVEQRTPMKDISAPDLERMKWHGVFYRKRDTPGTYMLRVRLTGCELTAKQAKEIAYVACDYGYGIVDITTRAGLQIQGLHIENVPLAVERLTSVGLTLKQTGHDNIRNVFCHPLSGVDSDEAIDTRPLCREISGLFLDNRTYSDLPRKFNIALNGRLHHGIHYWTQDISYLAYQAPEAGVMFQVLLGGTQGQTPHLGHHLPVLFRPDQVLSVTRALLDLFRIKGSREKRDQARFHFLIEQIGTGGVLAYLEEHLDFPLCPCVNAPPPPGGYDELVGWFRQKQANLWTMGLCVPLGRLSWQQLEGLAVLANKWGDGSLRTTHEQGIAVVDIPTELKEAAATDAAAHGLSLHADSLAQNTMACTGKQFCSIGVTEGKSRMFQLIAKLRQRTLTLHGIRIHMSGCPSGCAQHFTADIGLKGVRVRRLLGTREGFDVFLGGGISGQVRLGIPYKLGVDVGQLPQLIEEVVREYYVRHRPGQTFSAYWRDELRSEDAAKVADGEYTPPTWSCEGCGYAHLGENPPIFCPNCAGLRRQFARLEGGAEPTVQVSREGENSPPRPDGFLFAAKEEAILENQGFTVEVAGREYALFRVNDNMYAVDNVCPHEGAQLAQGEVQNGVVTCPWHGWAFDVCTGCSVAPNGHNVCKYETKVENGSVYIRTEGADSPPSVNTAVPMAASAMARGLSPKTATLRVVEVVSETSDTKTFRLDNSSGAIPSHRPGQFASVCITIEGREAWRNFTISSSTTQSDFLDLTVKRSPLGKVSNALHDSITAGSTLKIRAPQGAFYFYPDRHTEPLVLISAGSGITPMMSILRYLADHGCDLPCLFLYGARSVADIIFQKECAALAERMANLRYVVSLSRPSSDWNGLIGRIDFALVQELVANIRGSRYFLCGPGDFIQTLREPLLAAGVSEERVHTEAFHIASKDPSHESSAHSSPGIRFSPCANVGRAEAIMPRSGNASLDR